MFVVISTLVETTVLVDPEPNSVVLSETTQALDLVCMAEVWPIVLSGEWL